MVNKVASNLKTVIVSVIFGIAIAVPSAFAQSNPALQATMREMGATLRTITLQADDRSLNASSAEAALRLQELSLISKKQLPTTITSLPAEHQSERIAAWRAGLNELLKVCADMEDAFLRNANADVPVLIDAARDITARSHSDFRPVP